MLRQTGEWFMSEHYCGLTFIKTVDQVAHAAAEREGEFRKLYEDKLVELRATVGDLSVDDVLLAARTSGFVVLPEVAKVMLLARVCEAARTLATEYGFVAAQLRSEPDQTRQLKLTRIDMSLFETLDMRKFMARLPQDVTDVDDGLMMARQAFGAGRQRGRIATIAEYVAASKADPCPGIAGSILGGG